ncbi:hypothetical protein BASA81_014004 [Batrachochytrium salamandrivorans]|nr:hypothetical protein BASA81_014004 [Batrachochytrium salamandrivorans]
MNTSSSAFDGELLRLMNETPKIVDAFKNLLAQELATSTQFSQSELLSSVQLLLKQIRELVLIDPVEWGLKTPQLESQSGLERMDQIMKYKAAYTLHKQCQTKQHSTCKLLGKSFLGLVWSQVSTSVGNGGGPAMELVIRVMSQSLVDAGGSNEKSLVWEQDFNAALAWRQAQRVEQAKLREEQALKQGLTNALIMEGEEEEEEA